MAARLLNDLFGTGAFSGRYTVLDVHMSFGTHDCRRSCGQHLEMRSLARRTSDEFKTPLVAAESI